MALLDQLSGEIKKTRPHMQNEKMLFHQDNAPCHKSMITMVKLNECSFEFLPHPLYSPDLSLSDYWLFADLKKMLQRKRFDFRKRCEKDRLLRCLCGEWPRPVEIKCRPCHPLQFLGINIYREIYIL